MARSSSSSESSRSSGSSSSTTSSSSSDASRSSGSTSSPSRGRERSPLRRREERSGAAGGSSEKPRAPEADDGKRAAGEAAAAAPPAGDDTNTRLHVGHLTRNVTGERGPRLLGVPTAATAMCWSSAVYGCFVCTLWVYQHGAGTQAPPLWPSPAPSCQHFSPHDAAPMLGARSAGRAAVPFLPAAGASPAGHLGLNPRRPTAPSLLVVPPPAEAHVREIFAHFGKLRGVELAMDRVVNLPRCGPARAPPCASRIVWATGLVHGTHQRAPSCRGRAAQCFQPGQWWQPLHAGCWLSHPAAPAFPSPALARLQGLCLCGV